MCNVNKILFIKDKKNIYIYIYLYLITEGVHITLDPTLITQRTRAQKISNYGPFWTP